MSTSITSIFNQNTLSVIEGYALSTDKPQFIQSLPDGLEKKVLTALISPFQESSSYLPNTSIIPASLAIQIKERKIFEKVQSAKSISEIKDIISEMRQYEQPIFQQNIPLFGMQVSQTQQNIEDTPFRNEFPKNLDLQIPQDISSFIDKLIQEDPKQILSFSTYATRNIPQKTFLSLSFQLKEKLLHQPYFFKFLPKQFVTNFVKDFLEIATKKTSNYELNPQFYSSLTIEHINDLMAKIPNLVNKVNFVSIWFDINLTKKYPILSTQNRQLTLSKKEQKRKLLIMIIDKIKKQIPNPTQESLIKQFKLQLINIDIAIEDPSIDRFIQYISTIMENQNFFNERQNKNITVNATKNKSASHRSFLLGNFQSAKISMSQFVEDYIVSILNKYGATTELDNRLLEYIQENLYYKIKTKVTLAKGQKLDPSNKYLSENQITEIRDKKFLTIMNDNKKSYKVSDDVILKVKVKNLKKIKVKIYEINLEKHYLQNKSQISHQVKLDFLDPTYQFIYEIESKNPFQEEIFDMSIKEIKKERGVYVVDLDGYGISSRAFIKKGSIFCFKNITVAGVEVRFSDQIGKPLQNFGIWLKGQLIQVKQSYLFPFGQNPEHVTIVVKVGDFAQMMKVEIPAEEYTLKVQCFYNKESFIVGDKAKIVLSPRLYLTSKQQTLIDLKLLRNVRISALIEDEEYIKSTISFENINWNYQKDYVMEVPIQTYLKRITIEGVGEIKKYSGKKQKMKFGQTITLNSPQDTGVVNSFQRFYMNQINGQYTLRCLGLDGELIPKLPVRVNVKMNWVDKTIQKTLQTDQKGQIKLGELKYVSQISLPQLNLMWKIKSLAGTVQLSNKLHAKQNEQILIPIPIVSYPIIIGSDLNLFHRNDQTFMQNFNTKLNLKSGFIEITGLPGGTYSLFILSIDLSIQIVVMEGEQWENKTQIYNHVKSEVYQFTRDPNRYLTLGQPIFSKLDNDLTKLNINILKPEAAKINDNVKVHIFAYAYIPDEKYLQTVNLNTILDCEQIFFQPKRSSYYSNKKPSQEASYVLNRKQQKRFVGNNLQKPHILLNRIKVRDTKQNEEQLQGANNFGVAYNNQMVPPHLPSRISHFGSNQHLYRVQDLITSHNNFLAHSGLTICNQKGQNIEIIVPKHYSYISVLLTSNSSNVIRNFALPNSNISTKKIRHLGLKQEDANSAWSMSREIYHIGSAETKCISRTSKWCGVSLLQIIQFAKTHHIELEEWLEKWPTYSKEAKLETYSRKVCHQLNSYIKHHDKAFFDEVILPYISNKVNKSFVDLCLTEDKACQNWIPFQYFNELNGFEKILLIEFLVNKGNMQKADILTQAMVLKQKKNKYPYTFFKNKFDTMMNAQVLSNQTELLFSSNPNQQQTQDNQFNFMQMQQMQQVQQSQQPSFMMNVQQQQSPFATYASYNVLPDAQNLAYNNNYGGNVFSNSANNNNNNNNNSNLFSVPPSLPPPPSGGFFGFGASNAPSLPPPPAPMSFNPFNSSSVVPVQARNNYTQQFKQTQNTQQYIEVTYSGIQGSKQVSGSLIPQSKFWADLALHILHKKLNNGQNFINESVMHLTSQRQFTLAASFLPQDLNADYEITSTDANIILKAHKPFLLLTKEIKNTPFTPKSGIMINHRFCDPTDMHSVDEDGLELIKEVEEFIVGKQYILQTIITNTTSNHLETQLLIDIPEGSIPLNTREYTKSESFVISPFSTTCKDRQFYFPVEGEFGLYPANVCRDKKVIAKSEEMDKIKVVSMRTIKGLQNLRDVISVGKLDDIVKYLETKNVFDVQVFNPNEILWALKQEERFLKITAILRSKGYMTKEIWKFSLLHNSLNEIKQYCSLMKKYGPLVPDYNYVRILEYYPYYSSRAHKYQNQNKSTIRNIELKQTYYKFLFEEIVYHKGAQNHSFKLVASYYLLLQDRIQETSAIMKTLNESQRNKFKLQFDYLQCFLDMYEGFPNFNKARKICQNYANYPVKNWKALFNEIQRTLKDYDNSTIVTKDQKTIEYKTTLINQGEFLRLNIPVDTKVEIYLYSINLELLFSQNPFNATSEVSSIRAAQSYTYEIGEAREEKFKRPQDMKDLVVQIFESSNRSSMRKVDSFKWPNPSLKVKTNEKKGTLQVFYQNKPTAGAYCKVYEWSNQKEKFYRDGYTDITGTFKYALSDLKNITKFSILTLSDHGGVINQVAPPSQAGNLNNP